MNILRLSTAFFDGNGKIRTVQLTKPAPDTIVRPFNHRSTGFIATDDISGAKGHADPAAFAPVAKDDLIVSFSGQQ
jgi:hypothetical protein